MEEKNIEQINAVSEKVALCKKCDFHRVLEEKKILYKPDPPIIESSKLKIICVGINPGWNDKHYSFMKPAYETNNFDEYCKRRKSGWEKAIDKEGNSSNYFTSMLHFINDIDKYLNIINEKLLNLN